MPKQYPPEFRCKIPDLVASGRRVALVAADLDISDQTIYTRRRQELIASGQAPGTISTDNAELVAARRRIAELETEVAVHRRAAELLKGGQPPQKARGGHGDRLRGPVDPARLPRARGVRVRLLRLARQSALATVGPPSTARRSHPRDPREVITGLRRPGGTRRTQASMPVSSGRGCGLRRGRAGGAGSQVCQGPAGPRVLVAKQVMRHPSRSVRRSTGFRGRRAPASPAASPAGRACSPASVRTSRR